MTYQALARKWRPQDFSELVGQEPVVTALTHALRDGRTSQAYLFAGIRGVGKTSAARILAKALNCEGGPTPEPCGECLPCREITAGSDLDVLEIDAATHSKVDQVRELTESLRYGPARDRYKVVVLDEVHRLSRQAFDALLKIVEEPPEHLVFIFATTELEAVPATVLSRTQEYHFRRVPVARLAPYLETIAEAEEIDASPSALRLVSRASEGSVRDAVALLDQLATYADGEVSDEDAARLVGAYDPELFFALFDAITRGDRATVVDAVERVEAEGWDPKLLFGRFIAYCRDALHLSLDADAAVELPEDEAGRLADRVGALGFENGLRLLDHLLDSESLVRRTERSALAVEIALLRAAELPRLLDVETLLRRGSTPSPATPERGENEERENREEGEGAPPRDERPETEAVTPSDESVRTANAPAPRPETPLEDAAPPAAEHRSGATATDVDEGLDARDAAVEAARDDAESHENASTGTGRGPSEDSRIDRLLAAVSRHRQALAAHLDQSQRLRFEGDRLVVVRSPSDEWLVRALRRRGNREVLDRALSEVAGDDASWRLVEGDGAEPPVGEDASEAASDPGVQTVLDIFDGSIRSVEPNPHAKER